MRRARPALDLLDRWRDERIDFLRSVKLFKLNEARDIASQEIERYDFGGDECACTTCGVIFYDNLESHSGLMADFCSRLCQETARFECVQCETEYEVGHVNNAKKRIYISGLCSEECLKQFKCEQTAKSHYVSQMKRKAQKFGVAFDKSITRIDVYQRANGICYMCKQPTTLERSEKYNPLFATVDHVVPWTKGGSHTWDNVRLACFRCNVIKKDR